MNTTIPGMEVNQKITFESPEALERYVHVRVSQEADRLAKQKLMGGSISWKEVKEMGFPFGIRTLKKRINEGKIKGTIKGDNEVYVNIESLREYLKD